MANLSVERYSDKCIVIRGDDTKKYITQFKRLGGKWNNKLKDGAGWIFPISKEEDVMKFIETGEETDNNDIVKELLKEIFKTMTIEERLKFISEISILACHQ